MKDQLCQYLPQLVQMESGLDDCGILNHMRRNTQIWKPVFASANFFTITADEFQDSMIVNFSESQIRKDAEITTFKFFSDVLTSIDAGGILICSLKKKIIGNKKLLFNERVIISWHTLGRTWIFGVHQLPTEKVVLSLDYPTWIW